MDNKEELKKDNHELEGDEKLEEIKDDSETNSESEGESQEVDEKEKQEDDFKSKFDDLNNKFIRLQADFINYRNRVEREKKSLYASATEDIILQLLPVLDNFERALSNMDKDNAYYTGIKMIYDQMVNVLTNNGLKEIECLGEAFNPNFHHAVFMEECEDKDEGTIIEVLQKGYMLHEKVIRPSMVKVAK
ncbi:MAG TPA: nucleotide exchange factor GrpE [Tissierellia bacterium]|nr:nucleotide exchange factor GrpE [Tissierellia bacterium]